MIDLVLDHQRKAAGGFELRRMLPAASRRMVGPFAFFDHFGPVDLASGLPREADVRPHPHIGLATVTYLYQGEIMHRDSLGTAQAIRAGEVNWMTAGRGITHSERLERARLQGDRLHGIQAWVALPEAQEETAPGFSHHAMDAAPLLESPGVVARLVAGRAFGQQAPTPMFSPMFYIHWTLQEGAVAELAADYPERAAYVAAGEVEILGRTYGPGKMVLFKPGGAVAVKALQPATVMLLGGEPVGPRFLEWNFVASSRERIEQAKADWRAGRFALPQADHDEFIPLPPDPARAPEPLS